MGQFDSETDAVLAQLNFEELSKTPGSEFAEIVNDLLKLVGALGPWTVAGGAVSLLQRIRALAGASYASNLIFAITAVRDDLSDLRAKHAALQGRIDSLGTDPRFAEAIAVLALRAMHTSVKNRLKRLARIVVNGVKENDLEPESLDDLMRAAVEVKDEDIVLLGHLYKWQNHILIEKGMNPDKWFGDIQSAHKSLVNSGALNPAEHLKYRSSYSRLESLGLVQAIPSITNRSGVGYELYALLVEGKKFYERLQEIGATE
jgi:hypothetical protein